MNWLSKNKVLASKDSLCAPVGAAQPKGGGVHITETWCSACGFPWDT